MSASGSCLSGFGGLGIEQQERQRQYFREKKLYTLQIESTDVCRQGCIYCYAGSKPTETEGLTSAEIRSLVEEAARLGIRAIDWLGGDPLERHDWHDLMTFARSAGLVNNLWTSGLPLRDPAVARLVVAATCEGFVSVHLDSLNPDTYAGLHDTADPRNIADILEGVDNLLAAGKPPAQVVNCITYTSRQPPADAVATMRWWSKEKGIDTCLTIFNPAGTGRQWLSLAPGREETRLVCGERDRLNHGTARLSIGAMDTDKFYCGTMATVTFTGDVTPCSVIREGVGNIRTTPFARIVADHLGALIHEPLHDARAMPAPCDRCRHNAHCWGCRASAHNYGGDANGPDPKCWLVREARTAGASEPARPLRFMRRSDDGEAQAGRWD